MHRLLAASLELEAEEAAAAEARGSSLSPLSLSEPAAATEKNSTSLPLALPLPLRDPPASWCASRGLSSPQETALVAAHCNERRAAAKNVQDASSRLYLTALLLARPTALAAFATGVGGDRYVDCYVPDIGCEVRVQLEGAAADEGGGSGGSGFRSGSGYARGGRGGGARRTPSRDSPSPAPAGEGEGEEEEKPLCPAHGHLSKNWSAQAKRLTLSLSSRRSSPSAALLSPASSAAEAAAAAGNSNTPHLLPLHRPLHNPGSLEPATLPLALSHLSRVPVVVGAVEGAGPGGAPELTAWLLVEGGAWASRAAAGAESAAKEGEEKAERRKSGGRVSFVDDAAD